MKYWREKCPYCGLSTRRSDLDSEKGFGTPLIVCPRCKQSYIHPDRIELGMLSPDEQVRFKNRMLFSFVWRAIFFGLLIFAGISCIAHLSDLLSGLISASVTLLLILKLYRGNNRVFVEELKKSEERLSVPGYRELLERAGYKPEW